jgi:hypothetical protein
MSKKRILTLLALAALPLLAGPASATSCSADLLKVGSGQILLWGHIDEPAVQVVVILDAAGRARQYIRIEDPTFADLLSFAIEPGDDSLRAVFLDGANEIWCVQKLTLDRVVLDNGSGDGGSGGSRGRANP